MIISKRNQVKPFETMDGSIIRELMHPMVQGGCNQSLAEATVGPGSETLLHMHRNSEEIYHILSGSGCVKIGEEQHRVEVGDTILIPTGMRHNIKNNGEVDLVFLCLCSPAYDHEDTFLL